MFDRMSRRSALGTIASGALAPMLAKTALAQSTDSLGTIAAKNNLVFGAAAGPILFKDTAYRELYATQAKIITTDVALKIGTIAPMPGAKRFESADRLLGFCASRKIPMRGHCLIWNEWVPPWIKAMSTTERRAYFDAYIDEVVSRYAGRLHSWDVVNEPFWPGHRAPGGYRVGPWYDAFGTDYIRRAFERAAHADPTTRLMLNEAQTERDDVLGLTVRAGLLKLVKELKDAGVKLDAVGLQGHLQPQYPHDAARFQDFLHELAAEGVDIYVTEFDVRDDTFPDDIPTRDTQVAAVAERFLGNVLKVPQVKALITWQLADNYSFYRGIAKQKNPATTRLPRPLPYDEQYRRKPLWFALAKTLQNGRA
jgi:endo-1,4-beta-xylanase